MDYNVLKKLVDQNLSICQIAEQLNRRPSGLNYWLQKHNLKTQYKRPEKPIEKERSCKKCGLVLSIDQFRRNKDGPIVGFICRTCYMKRNANGRKNLKIRLVEYKGGKCQICGYNKCAAALNFHHVDPSKKEFNIATKGLSIENQREELDKCVLVCCNCHREIHGGVAKIEDIKYGL